MTAPRVLLIGSDGGLGSIIRGMLAVGSHFDLITSGSVSRGGVDISDFDATLRLLDHVRPEVVVNAAGVAHVTDSFDTNRLFGVNAEGPANIVTAAAKSGCSHVVHLSSVSVYGRAQGGAIDEGTVTAPVGPYAESKAVGEALATQSAAATGIGLTVLRLASVAQTGRHGNLGELVDSVSRGRFFWVGSGANMRSLLARSDLLKAISESVSPRGISHKGVRFYNVASRPVAMRDLVDAIASAAGREIHGPPIPKWIARPAAWLLGGSMGIPTLERLNRFLGSEVYLTSAFERDFGVVFDGNPLEDLRQAVTQPR